MTYFKKTCLLSLIYLLSLTLSAQITSIEKTYDNSVFLVKQTNGMNSLLVHRPEMQNIEISYYVKIGPVYENDSLSGISNILQSILSGKIRAYLKDSRNVLATQGMTFNAYMTTELSVYQLMCTPENYALGLELLRDSLSFSNISDEELQNKIKAVSASIENKKKDVNFIFSNKMLKLLYRQDANELSLTGNPEKFKYIDLEHIRQFLKKYYVPNNTFLNASGNLSVTEFQTVMGERFKVVSKSLFDPETVSKIIDFKPMVYTTQFAVNAPVQQPEFHICWQFPGTRSNVQSSYYAFLLSSMLNDPNNYIQVKAKKLGCKRLVSEYEANNFSGIFKITLLPDKAKMKETYSLVLTELQRLDKILLNETSMNMGKILFKKEYDEIKASKDYTSWMTKYWVYGDETYFPVLKDSIFTLGENRMRKFIIEYINESPHVTGLLIGEQDRNTMKVDTFFADLDESVNDYVFTYRKNITDLENSENALKLNRLTQWLTINPDLIVQVNGFADETEFNKTSDRSISDFIDSIPTFEKVKKEMIKTSYMRPEMLRAMKIIKYLHERGIDVTRLKGTSMMFHSKTKEEADANMKCTLTIDKIKLSPSLYEYHFGKTKEQNEKKHK